MLEKNNFIVLRNFIAIISIFLGFILAIWWFIQSTAMYAGGGMYVRPLQSLLIYIFLIIFGIANFLNKIVKKDTKYIYKNVIYLTFTGLLIGISITVLAGYVPNGIAHMEITYADYASGWPIPWLVLYYPYENYFDLGRILIVNFLIDTVIWSILSIQFVFLIAGVSTKKLPRLRNKITMMSSKSKKIFSFFVPLILVFVLISSTIILLDSNNDRQTKREISFWLNELNSLDTDEIDEYERGSYYEPFFIQEVEHYKEELQKLGVTVTWDSIQKIYVINDINEEGSNFQNYDGKKERDKFVGTWECEYDTMIFFSNGTIVSSNSGENVSATWKLEYEKLFIDDGFFTFVFDYSFSDNYDKLTLTGLGGTNTYTKQ